MSIQAVVRQAMGYTRTIEGDFISEGDNGYTVNGLDNSATLDDASTPAVSNGSVFAIPLVAGVVSINLAAIPEDDGTGTFDATGLKVQAIIFFNPLGNAAMTIIEGAANGHPTLGAGFVIVLQPGQAIMLQNRGADVGTDVAAGDRLIDVAGTGTQILHVGVVVG